MTRASKGALVAGALIAALAVPIAAQDILLPPNLQQEPPPAQDFVFPKAPQPLYRYNPTAPAPQPGQTFRGYQSIPPSGAASGFQTDVIRRRIEIENAPPEITESIERREQQQPSVPQSYPAGDAVTSQGPVRELQQFTPQRRIVGPAIAPAPPAELESAPAAPVAVAPQPVQVETLGPAEGDVQFFMPEQLSQPAGSPAVAVGQQSQPSMAPTQQDDRQARIAERQREHELATMHLQRSTSMRDEANQRVEQLLQGAAAGAAETGVAMQTDGAMPTGPAAAHQFNRQIPYGELLAATKRIGRVIAAGSQMATVDVGTAPSGGEGGGTGATGRPVGDGPSIAYGSEVLFTIDDGSDQRYPGLFDPLGLGLTDPFGLGFAEDDDDTATEDDDGASTADDDDGLSTAADDDGASTADDDDEVVVDGGGIVIDVTGTGSTAGGSITRPPKKKDDEDDGGDDPRDVGGDDPPPPPDPVDHPVIAYGDYGIVDRDETVLIYVTLNDEIKDGLFKTEITRSARKGTVQSTGTPGVYKYKSRLHAEGEDTFSYRAWDADTGDKLPKERDTATVLLEIWDNPVIAVGDAAQTIRARGVSIAGVSLNDEVEDGIASVRLSGGAGHGTVRQTGFDTFWYQPRNNFVGGDSFAYIIKDVDDDSDVGIVSIAVGRPPRPPAPPPSSMFRACLDQARAEGYDVDAMAAQANGNGAVDDAYNDAYGDLAPRDRSAGRIEQAEFDLGQAIAAEDPLRYEIALAGFDELTSQRQIAMDTLLAEPAEVFDRLVRAGDLSETGVPVHPLLSMADLPAASRLWRAVNTPAMRRDIEAVGPALEAVATLEGAVPGLARQVNDIYLALTERDPETTLVTRLLSPDDQMAARHLVRQVYRSLPLLEKDWARGEASAEVEAEAADRRAWMASYSKKEWTGAGGGAPPVGSPAPAKVIEALSPNDLTKRFSAMAQVFYAEVVGRENLMASREITGPNEFQTVGVEIADGKLYRQIAMSRDLRLIERQPVEPLDPERVVYHRERIGAAKTMQADAQIAALRARYAPKVEQLGARVALAADELERVVGTLDVALGVREAAVQMPIFSDALETSRRRALAAFQQGRLERSAFDTVRRELTALGEQASGQRKELESAAAQRPPLMTALRGFDIASRDLRAERVRLQTDAVYAGSVDRIIDIKTPEYVADLQVASARRGAFALAKPPMRVFSREGDMTIADEQPRPMRYVVEGGGDPRSLTTAFAGRYSPIADRGFNDLFRYLAPDRPTVGTRAVVESLPAAAPDQPIALGPGGADLSRFGYRVEPLNLEQRLLGTSIGKELVERIDYAPAARTVKEGVDVAGYIAERASSVAERVWAVDANDFKYEAMRTLVPKSYYELRDGGRTVDLAAGVGAPVRGQLLPSAPKAFDSGPETPGYGISKGIGQVFRGQVLPDAPPSQFLREFREPEINPFSKRLPRSAALPPGPDIQRELAAATTAEYAFDTRSGMILGDTGAGSKRPGGGVAQIGAVTRLEQSPQVELPSKGLGYMALRRSPEALNDPAGAEQMYRDQMGGKGVVHRFAHPAELAELSPRELANGGIGKSPSARNDSNFLADGFAARSEGTGLTQPQDSAEDAHEAARTQRGDYGMVTNRSDWEDPEFYKEQFEARIGGFGWVHEFGSLDEMTAFVQSRLGGLGVAYSCLDLLRQGMPLEQIEGIYDSVAAHGRNDFESDEDYERRMLALYPDEYTRDSDGELRHRSNAEIAATRGQRLLDSGDYIVDPRTGNIVRRGTDAAGQIERRAGVSGARDVEVTLADGRTGTLRIDGDQSLRDAAEDAFVRLGYRRNASGDWVTADGQLVMSADELERLDGRYLDHMDRQLPGFGQQITYRPDEARPDGQPPPPIDQQFRGLEDDLIDGLGYVVNDVRIGNARIDRLEVRPGETFEDALRRVLAGDGRVAFDDNGNLVDRRTGETLLGAGDISYMDADYRARVADEVFGADFGEFSEEVLWLARNGTPAQQARARQILGDLRTRQSQAVQATEAQAAIQDRIDAVMNDLNLNESERRALLRPLQRQLDAATETRRTIEQGLLDGAQAANQSGETVFNNSLSIRERDAVQLSRRMQDIATDIRDINDRLGGDLSPSERRRLELRHAELQRRLYETNAEFREVYAALATPDGAPTGSLALGPGGVERRVDRLIEALDLAPFDIDAGTAGDIRAARARAAKVTLEEDEEGGASFFVYRDSENRILRDPSGNPFVLSAEDAQQEQNRIFNNLAREHDRLRPKLLRLNGDGERDLGLVGRFNSITSRYSELSEESKNGALGERLRRQAESTLAEINQLQGELAPFFNQQLGQFSDEDKIDIFNRSAAIKAERDANREAYFNGERSITYSIDGGEEQTYISPERQARIDEQERLRREREARLAEIERLRLEAARLQAQQQQQAAERESREAQRKAEADRQAAIQADRGERESRYSTAERLLNNERDRRAEAKATLDRLTGGIGNELSAQEQRDIAAARQRLNESIERETSLERQARRSQALAATSDPLLEKRLEAAQSRIGATKSEADRLRAVVEANYIQYRVQLALAEQGIGSPEGFRAILEESRKQLQAAAQDLRNAQGIREGLIETAIYGSSRPEYNAQRLAELEERARRAGGSASEFLTGEDLKEFNRRVRIAERNTNVAAATARAETLGRAAQQVYRLGEIERAGGTLTSDQRAEKIRLQVDLGRGLTQEEQNLLISEQQRRSFENGPQGTRRVSRMIVDADAGAPIPEQQQGNLEGSRQGTEDLGALVFQRSVYDAFTQTIDGQHGGRTLYTTTREETSSFFAPLTEQANLAADVRRAQALLAERQASFKDAEAKYRANPNDDFLRSDFYYADRLLTSAENMERSARGRLNLETTLFQSDLAGVPTNPDNNRPTTQFQDWRQTVKDLTETRDALQLQVDAGTLPQAVADGLGAAVSQATDQVEFARLHTGFFEQHVAQLQDDAEAERQRQQREQAGRDAIRGTYNRGVESIEARQQEHATFIQTHQERVGTLGTEIRNLTVERRRIQALQADGETYDAGRLATLNEQIGIKNDLVHNMRARIEPRANLIENYNRTIGVLQREQAHIRDQIENNSDFNEDRGELRIAEIDAEIKTARGNVSNLRNRLGTSVSDQYAQEVQGMFEQLPARHAFDLAYAAEEGRRRSLRLLDATQELEQFQQGRQRGESVFNSRVGDLQTAVEQARASDDGSDGSTADIKRLEGDLADAQQALYEQVDYYDRRGAALTRTVSTEYWQNRNDGIGPRGEGQLRASAADANISYEVYTAARLDLVNNMVGSANRIVDGAISSDLGAPRQSIVGMAGDELIGEDPLATALAMTPATRALALAAGVDLSGAGRLGNLGDPLWVGKAVVNAEYGAAKHVVTVMVPGLVTMAAGAIEYGADAVFDTTAEAIGVAIGREDWFGTENLDFFATAPERGMEALNNFSLSRTSNAVGNAVSNYFTKMSRAKDVDAAAAQFGGAVAVEAGSLFLAPGSVLGPLGRVAGAGLNVTNRTAAALRLLAVQREVAQAATLTNRLTNTALRGGARLLNAPADVLRLGGAALSRTGETLGAARRGLNQFNPNVSDLARRAADRLLPDIIYNGRALSASELNTVGAVTRSFGLADDLVRQATNAPVGEAGELLRQAASTRRFATQLLDSNPAIARGFDEIEQFRLAASVARDHEALARAAQIVSQPIAPGVRAARLSGTGTTAAADRLRTTRQALQLPPRTRTTVQGGQRVTTAAERLRTARQGTTAATAPPVRAPGVAPPVPRAVGTTTPPRAPQVATAPAPVRAAPATVPARPPVTPQAAQAPPVPRAGGTTPPPRAPQVATAPARPPVTPQAAQAPPVPRAVGTTTPPRAPQAAPAPAPVRAAPATAPPRPPVTPQAAQAPPVVRQPAPAPPPASVTPPPPAAPQVATAVPQTPPIRGAPVGGRTGVQRQLFCENCGLVAAESILKDAGIVGAERSQQAMRAFAQDANLMTPGLGMTADELAAYLVRHGIPNTHVAAGAHSMEDMGRAIQQGKDVSALIRVGDPASDAYHWVRVEGFTRDAQGVAWVSYGEGSLARGVSKRVTVAEFDRLTRVHAGQPDAGDRLASLVVDTQALTGAERNAGRVLAADNLRAGNALAPPRPVAPLPTLATTAPPPRPPALPRRATIAPPPPPLAPLPRRAITRPTIEPPRVTTAPRPTIEPPRVAGGAAAPTPRTAPPTQSVAARVNDARRAERQGRLTTILDRAEPPANLSPNVAAERARERLAALGVSPNEVSNAAADALRGVLTRRRDLALQAQSIRRSAERANIVPQDSPQLAAALARNAGRQEALGRQTALLRGLRDQPVPSRVGSVAGPPALAPAPRLITFTPDEIALGREISRAEALPAARLPHTDVVPPRQFPAGDVPKRLRRMASRARAEGDVSVATRLDDLAREAEAQAPVARRADFGATLAENPGLRQGMLAGGPLAEGTEEAAAARAAIAKFLDDTPDWENVAKRLPTEQPELATRLMEFRQDVVWRELERRFGHRGPNGEWVPDIKAFGSAGKMSSDIDFSVLNRLPAENQIAIERFMTSEFPVAPGINGFGPNWREKLHMAVFADPKLIHIHSRLPTPALQQQVRRNTFGLAEAADLEQLRNTNPALFERLQRQLGIDGQALIGRYPKPPPSAVDDLLRARDGALDRLYRSNFSDAEAAEEVVRNQIQINRLDPEAYSSPGGVMATVTYKEGQVPFRSRMSARPHNGEIAISGIPDSVGPTGLTIEFPSGRDAPLFENISDLRKYVARMASESPTTANIADRLVAQRTLGRLETEMLELGPIERYQQVLANIGTFEHQVHEAGTALDAIRRYQSSKYLSRVLGEADSLDLPADARRLVSDLRDMARDFYKYREDTIPRTLASDVALLPPVRVAELEARAGQMLERVRELNGVVAAAARRDARNALGLFEPGNVVRHGQNPGRFLRQTYGRQGTDVVRAYRIARAELGDDVLGIAGSYARGEARIGHWPEGVGSFDDAIRVDKAPLTLTPDQVARLPESGRRAVSIRRANEGRLPSDLDVPTSLDDAERLLEVQRRVFNETGVAIEFVTPQFPFIQRPGAAGTEVAALTRPAVGARRADIVVPREAIVRPRPTIEYPQGARSRAVPPPEARGPPASGTGQPAAAGAPGGGPPGPPRRPPDVAAAAGGSSSGRLPRTERFDQLDVPGTTPRPTQRVDVPHTIEPDPRLGGTQRVDVPHTVEPDPRLGGTQRVDVPHTVESARLGTAPGTTPRLDVGVPSGRQVYEPDGFVPFQTPTGSTVSVLERAPDGGRSWNTSIGKLTAADDWFARGGSADAVRLLDENNNASGVIAKFYEAQTGKWPQKYGPHSIAEQQALVDNTLHGASRLKDADILQAEIVHFGITGEGGYVIQREVGRNLPGHVESEIILKARLEGGAPLTSKEKDALADLFDKLDANNIAWEDPNTGNIFLRKNKDGSFEAGILDQDRIGVWDDIDPNRDYVLWRLGNNPGEIGARSVPPGGGGIQFDTARQFNNKTRERFGYWRYLPGRGYFGGYLDLGRVQKRFPDLPDNLPPGWNDWVVPPPGKQSLLLILPDVVPFAPHDISRLGPAGRRFGDSMPAEVPPLPMAA